MIQMQISCMFYNEKKWNMILNNRFTLDTMKISFIKHSLSIVEIEMKSILFGTFNDKWKQKKDKLKDSSELTSFVLKSDSEVIKVLLWQPVSINFDLVVFLTNMSDGWQTLLNVYFNEFKREIIRVRFSDDAREYPAYLFEYMGPSNHRIVQGLKDSYRWDFFESGIIMPFENGANYKKRRIADRLNNDIINEYLKKNGIDINENDFWVSNEDAIEFSTRLSD